MNLSDLTVQSKIQGGDIREFERLFERYYGPLCREADKILNDMDAAEDVVQEFFYQFWKNREAFRLKLSLNAYFYRSIRNNALRYLEHLAVRRNYAEKVLGEMRDAAAAVVQPDTEMKDLGRAIEATLQQLPDRCSLVFRMNRFEGLKYHEIAKILSISVKTVEADMGRALQLFRKSLKAYRVEEAGTRPRE